MTYVNAMPRALTLAFVAFTLPARIMACDLALALAVDVSGSVDPYEYQLQMQGLADALRDSAVSEALVRAEAAVLLVQWTGSSRQEVTLPWRRMRDFDDIEDLAAAIETAPRRWRNFSTAIGQALDFTMAQFGQAPACKRRVIDVSGDGPSNEGVEPRALHAALREAGIVVNGLAIEGSAEDLTGYFFENLIVGEGAFVVTANSFEDYPARIRLKLIRETTAQLSCVAGCAAAPRDEG